MEIKICGITNRPDALAAADAGADALGFIFYPGSPRFIPPEQAREIINRLPPGIAAVGVFVNSAPEEILRVAAFVGLTMVQLHGDE
ncbi:MAG: phosphoribosylanthranilate isomerase, partial [Deltaproteobacteria bacterium]|nr:phosphoribosylanthranilate isomerase [Deltaproteobacteria bacterium]